MTADEVGQVSQVGFLGAAVVLVAALADNGVIGAGGGIPWHLPADFAHFKRTTLGHPLVLGRTTFASIGRPLPGRQNIVVTRDPAWAHEGVLVAGSVEAAIALGRSLDPVVMVGGGAQVYAAALPLATHQVLSLVHLAPAGDTHYPAYDETEWRETSRESHADDDPEWEVVRLERR